MLNTSLIAGVRFGAVALNLLYPIISRLKLLKVALPKASVFLVRVPLKVPIPLLNERVIGTPLVATGSPIGCTICTTTGGRVAPGIFPLTGWLANTSLSIDATRTLKDVAR
jgi:hypothetical protein